ncbi:MAG: DEAD/DEAH box helicase [Ferrovibrionaceae bacterium]
MPEHDPERLEIADGLRRQLAIENELSRPQARAFVRCLQASWQVPTIQWTERDSNGQLTDARRLLHAAHVFREIEGTASRRALDCYRRAGEILEWLARANDGAGQEVPIELLAACAYQLGGLPAMASGLLAQIRAEHEGLALYGAFLRADFDGVLLRSAHYWSANPDLTVPAAGRLIAAVDDREENDRIGRYLTVELIRSLGLVADSLRRGDDARLGRAMEKLKALDMMATRILSDDASLIISLLYQVATSYKAASIYGAVRVLADFNPERQGRLLTYARDQFSRGRGVLWSSQLQGIERLRQESSFALCTPTGSGKTLIANLALVRELLLREVDGLAPLAMYLVPSRALAGEVEAKLRSELGSDMTVTALYGGADWGITDAWLTGDQPTVLIATVEKADALMRYLGPILTARLRLIIVDEAHQVVPEANENTRISFSEHSNRAIRLEQLVSRVLIQRPDVVRIALTAVAGGAAGPVAKWIEGRADATAVGVRYRSTRQVIGVLETAPGAQGRILLDVMNGRTLYIRGQEQPVFLPLRMPAMPNLPARIHNSLNRFNSLSVLWTALHLVEEDQRILISVAQEPERTMRWFKEALLLPAWANAPQFQPPEGSLRDRFDEARAACRDYCGENSFEMFLLERGIASSHGQMPQRLRRLMTEMIERRICPITIATATLTEGVNLPFDLIFLTSLKRRSWDRVAEQQVVTPLHTSEIRNLAGRAGRPGAAKGIEGMMLIAIPTREPATAPSTIPVQRRQRVELQRDYDRMREALLIEEADAGEVESPLALLLWTIRERAIGVIGIDPDDFLYWLESAVPADISEEAGQDAADRRSRLADAVDELDGILLTAIEEVAKAEEQEMSSARAEEHLAQLWSTTFSAVAAEQEAWFEEAFVQRGRGLVETVYPDATERRRLYQYGFTPLVGRRFDAVVPQIRALHERADRFGEDEPTGRIDVFEAIGDLLTADRGFGFRVRSTDTDQTLLDRWADVLRWWMNEPESVAPDAAALRSWQRFVADNLEFRLGVAIGAVVAQAWSEGAADAFAVPTLAEWKETTGMPWFGFWARELLRWGTHDPFVAFALSQGLAQTRDAATAQRGEFEAWLEDELDEVASEDLIDPQYFLRWQLSLRREARDRIEDRPELVELTGTDGRRHRYNVIPVRREGRVRWIDPAGFELAQSDDIFDKFGPGAIRSDFELRTEGAEAQVHRIFAASR